MGRLGSLCQVELSVGKILRGQICYTSGLSDGLSFVLTPKSAEKRIPGIKLSSTRMNLPAACLFYAKCVSLIVLISCGKIKDVDFSRSRHFYEPAGQIPHVSSVCASTLFFPLYVTLRLNVDSSSEFVFVCRVFHSE